ncbi:precorrin-6Y C5,15-methyltransferase [Longispora fulva]|uniref:Precorrin-6Y C5,15-methyltransferase (Decarboxylating) n=1 Tax=Longispora fulva TaxID=619741 RepID=A0A8J7KXK9_9ACTN|nr:precorrin-6y C5,15-methyltransferase (decarboxylating) subunit CbiE [Longispora fulva]MBG6137987.1 precorrin-6Y C5,15-methyltransferase (decarboxylating) [Longispora fulva]GIG60240.1 precorrin-6Y C5,15-methyltransferase [Longispora fulva]
MITVVGIGADGWAGLAPGSRAAIAAAEVLVGSPRQLDLVPSGDPVASGGRRRGDASSSEHNGRVGPERITLPTPLAPGLPALLGRLEGRDVCVLASGDPLFYGIGSTLIRLLGPDAVRVLPHPSSVALACARLGWAVQDTPVHSVVGRPVEAIHPGGRFLVLSADGRSPAAVASFLTAHGYGASRLTVLEQLGGPVERRLTGTAESWSFEDLDPLNVIAVECPEPPASRVPGLPDESYDHDGQLTKREIRALTLARLAPRPGELLWDVGAGNGSIGIEWMRSHVTCRALAIESHPDRLARIAANAAALGVPGLRIVAGRAPEALGGLDAPDAVFVGGGLTVPGVVDACWDALRPGGRLVANAVTLETEAVVAARFGTLGGDLTRIAVARAAPVGGFTGWRPAMPVTQWTVVKE